MTLLPAFLRTPSHRRVDVGLILALLANVLLLGAPALAWATGHPIDLTSPVAWACGAVLLVQAVLLIAVARRHARRAERHLDIDRLVRAMGPSGPIRLGGDDMRAESSPGLRLKHVRQRMAEAMRQVHRSAHELRQAAQALDHSGAHLSHRNERSAKSLHDIATALGRIAVIVQASAHAAQEARTLAASATTLGQEGGAQLQGMTQRLHEIDEVCQRLSACTIEHGRNIAVVNQSVKALDAMKRQNMGAVETSRRIAHTLAQQAAQLEAVLGSFELGDQAVATAQPAAAHAAAVPPAGGPASVHAEATADRSASRQLAAAVIQAAAQPRTAAPGTPPGLVQNRPAAAP